MEMWHNLSVDETLKELASGREGISAREAEDRLARYGPNELEASGARPAALTFLRQFASPLI